MKIAIIGAGISGLTAAYILNQKHEVTVFESNKRLGGHTATKRVVHKDNVYAIDTGFIVFNDWTYPNFQRLLSQLGVAYKPTDMGFSVSCDKTGLEYSGTNINTLFAQRRNVFNIKHWRMIQDILRFNKESLQDVDCGGEYLEITLGEYLQRKNYSKAFIDQYLIPMGAAIWSASTRVMKNFSLQFFVRFFRNHGLLSINDRPQWYVIEGGSNSYIDPLIRGFKKNIRLNTPIKKIHRDQANVQLELLDGSVEEFDEVVIATHSDQALNMLAKASEEEVGVLSAIPYQNNEVVLHTDTQLLPRKRLAWSSWNYRIVDNGDADTQLPVLTYDMNILQSIESEDTFCVTLNKTDAIDPDKILGVYHYAHPVFSMKSVDAQARWKRINGVNKTWFCGAYWGNGFHEDGVLSALRVSERLGASL